MNRKIVLILSFALLFVTILPLSVSADRLPSFELPRRELPKHELPDFRLPELAPLEKPELSVNFDERISDLQGRGLGNDFVLPEVEMRDKPKLELPNMERLIPENKIIPRPSESFFGRLRRFTLERLPILSNSRIFRPEHDLAAKEAEGRIKFANEDTANKFLEETPKPEGYGALDAQLEAARATIEENQTEIDQNKTRQLHDAGSDVMNPNSNPNSKSIHDSVRETRRLTGNNQGWFSGISNWIGSLFK